MKACALGPPAQSVEIEAWASVDATSQNSSHRCSWSDEVVPQSLGKGRDRGPHYIACCAQGEAALEMLEHALGVCRASPLATDTLPSQLTFSTLLLPLAAPACQKAHSSLAESQSVLCPPPPLGKSECVPTRASGPYACSQAGADQNTPPAQTRTQQVPLPIPWP